MTCGANEGGASDRFNSPAEAVAAMCGATGGRVVGVERVRLTAATGRVLAESVAADRDSPALDVSAMDGFAVRVVDCGGDRLPISTVEAAIGHPRVRLEGGSAVRIVTGAPVPIGAEAVVKREDVEERDGVLVLSAGLREQGVRAGLNIRRRGENAAAGAVVVGSGAVLNAAIAGAAAAFGWSELAVRRRVRVTIVTTGDELVPVEAQPEAWQLRDSNAAALRAMLAARAWIEVVQSDRVRDDPAAIASAVKVAAEQGDAVVLTGGVSMGDRDFVPRVVSELGAKVVFHKLPQRPGRPMLGAVMPDGVPVFGLPGNPVSVMVTARRLVLPVLASVAGAGAGVVAGVRRTTANPDETRLDLWWHRLVCERGDGRLVWVGGRGSGDVVAAAGSSGFVEVPPGEAGAGPWDYYAW